MVSKNRYFVLCVLFFIFTRVDGVKKEPKAVLKTQDEITAYEKMEKFLSISRKNFSNIKFSKLETAVVKLLYENGLFDVNEKDSKGWTPLICAVNDANLDLAAYFIPKGADINAADNEGKTALILSAENGYLDNVDWLLAHGASAQKLDNQGFSALFYLILSAFPNKEVASMALVDRKQYMSVIEKLVKKSGTDLINIKTVGKNKGLTMLNHLCCFIPKRWLNDELCFDVINCLLENSADPNIADDDDNTPLLNLVKRDVAVEARNEEYYTKVAEKLLAKNANINAQNNNDESALMCIFASDRKKIGQYYLDIFVKQQNINLNLRDKKGMTALMLAVMSGWGVEKLLEYHADPLIKNNDGKTALDIAKEKKYKDITELLEKAEKNAKTDQQLILLANSLGQLCNLA